MESDRNALDCALHIFVDGPKKPSDILPNLLTKFVTRRKWRFGNVWVHCNTANRGLRASMEAGVSWMTRKYPRVVVLEDDIQPLPGFLDFMSRALKRYERETRVMQISAYAYPVKQPGRSSSFLPLTSCWGWGTWSRAWSKYGLREREARRDLKSKVFINRMDLQGAYPYSQLLAKVLMKKSDSWGVIWYWNLLRHNGVSLFPPTSYVRNMGWDGSGTHGDRQGFGSDPADHGPPAAFPEWPKKIRTNQQLMNDLKNLFRHKP